ncbi:MAG: hypothetical protein QOH67_4376 [Hyphomicrobiales bacterium]|nr:hypothetical protein [Hyphomicrobiales bacterium]
MPGRQTQVCGGFVFLFGLLAGPSRLGLVAGRVVSLLAHAVDVGIRRRNASPPARYFGCTLGLPPGEPGGGMTFIVPPSGGLCWIPASTPAGGQITPFDSAS